MWWWAATAVSGARSSTRTSACRNPLRSAWILNGTCARDILSPIPAWSWYIVIHPASNRCISLDLMREPPRPRHEGRPAPERARCLQFRVVGVSAAPLHNKDRSSASGSSAADRTQAVSDRLMRILPRSAPAGGAPARAASPLLDAKSKSACTPLSGDSSPVEWIVFPSVSRYGCIGDAVRFGTHRQLQSKPGKVILDSCPSRVNGAARLSVPSPCVQART